MTRTPSEESASPPAAPADDGLTAFGRFRFDSATGELWRNGHAVRLAPKPAQVLRLLLASAGQLLSRRDIEREVWGDAPIDLDRSVNFAVRQIRSALGDNADSPTYIETLPKRGYRFIAPVSRVRRHGATVPETERTPEDKPHSSGLARIFASPLVIVTLLALVAVGIVATARAVPSEGAAAVRPMLVVLPLNTLDEDDRLDYFASGLTDELITRLARLDPSRLGVIARTSALLAARDGAPPSLAARALSASYVLTGSVRPDSTSVRVNVRLETDDGAVLWSERYVEPVPTTLALEFNIAARVSAALREQLIPDLAQASPDAVPTASPARDPYLRGSYLLRQGRARRADAVASLTAALAADSTYAPAHAAMGRALLAVGDTSGGRQHLRKAIELDPTLSAPHVALAVDALYALWDQDTADLHFREALRLDPGNVLSHHPYAYHLSIAGRHEEAVYEMETALGLDPVSPLVNGDVGRIYYRAGRFEEAKAQCERTLGLVPDDATALSCLVNINMLEGRPDLALPYARLSVPPNRPKNPGLDDPDPDVAMRHYFEGKLEGLSHAAEAGVDVHVAVAQAALWLGRTDDALDSLETALRIRSRILPQVPGDPCFAVLEGNPRYEAIVAAMGLTGVSE